MEWWHSGSSRSKFKSEFKNSVEKSSPRCLGMKTSFSSLIIFQRDKLLKLSVTHRCWCHYKAFEGKKPCKFRKGVLFFHENSLVHRALATQKELVYLGFHCLDRTPYSPGLAPRTISCSLDSKESEMLPFFFRRVGHCHRGYFVGRKYSEFFELITKLHQQAKKPIEIRVAYVEYILRLVAPACFLHGRSKDLSATSRMLTHKFISLVARNWCQNDFIQFSIILPNLKEPHSSLFSLFRLQIHRRRIYIILIGRQLEL